MRTLLVEITLALAFVGLILLIGAAGGALNLGGTP